MSYDFFKTFEGKKVLIAGASGMTGHNLYDFVRYHLGDAVGTCLNNNATYQDGRGLFYKVDFTDPKQAYRFFYEFDFDMAFVCAARTYNAFICEANPQSMILPNVQIVSNILENCLRRRVKKVVYISSATVYQDADRKLSEDELDWNSDPNSLYMGVGWMKRYAEKLCAFYASMGLNVNVVRPTNIYGRYDKTDEAVCHVIPALIMRALRGEDPYVIHGTGKPIKDFIHVDDLCRDISMVASEYDSPSPINLCSGETSSINDVVSIILKHLEFDPRIRYSGGKDRVPYKALDRSKFDGLFGRQNYKSLNDGIKDTIEWFSLLPQTQKR